MEATASNPFTCEHTTTAVRRKRDSAGRRMYRRQCLACGRGIGEWIKEKSVPEIWNVTDWDTELEAAGDAASRSHWDDLAAARNAELAERSAEWWAKYNAYLRGEKWGGKRDRVLKRDGYMCQACLTRRATQVHHKTYAHVFNEPLFDLVSVCEVCHDAITQMDRERRSA